MTATADAPLYDLRDVRRVYRTGGGEVRALDGVDIRIDTGEFLAVEGPSGSGKSTLLQLLGALDRPTSGSLTFDGRDLSRLGDRDLTSVRSRDIGFVFQAFNLIPTLTAAEKWRPRWCRRSVIAGPVGPAPPSCSSGSAW